MCILALCYANISIYTLEFIHWLHELLYNSIITFNVQYLRIFFANITYVAAVFAISF